MTELEEPVSTTRLRDDAPFKAALIVESEAGRDGVAAAEPITIGVPLGRGLCVDETSLTLTDEAGRPAALQARALARWPDGSIKWALLDFQHTAVRRRTSYCLGRSNHPAPAGQALTVDASDGRVLIDTGAARFAVDRTAFPFRQVSVGDRDVLRWERSGLSIEDAQGRCFTPRIDTVAVEDAGSLRTVVRVTGAVVGQTGELVTLEARLHFFAGLSTVRVAITLLNPRRAEHKGGFWELGDAGSVFMRDVSLSLAPRLGAPSVARYSPEPGIPFRDTAEGVEVYQDSSGGENWMSPAHVNKDGVVPNTFRGYRVRVAAAETPGLRATPHVALSGPDAGVSVAMPQFWQNFPKALEAGAEAVVLRLWPSQYADVHELQGGEQKTHTFHVHFGGRHFNLEALEWTRRPSVAAADPAWYSASGAVPFLTPAADDPHAAHQQLIAAAIAGPHAFEQKREVVDEYGWRNFGDLYADHEAVFNQGEATFVSHYNNQYDGVGGFATQFMRTGDLRWWRAMNELASHVVDIDIYHATDDKAAYNGGLFWHTCHHIAAGRSTHRSYPNAPGTNGGGPGNEHDYGSGLLLHYFLTGDRSSMNTVIGLARWVADMDNGRKTPLAPLTADDTGLASFTDAPDFHGPGRGAAYSVQSLLDGFGLTGDRSFMEKAEQLIRRCIHPDDDVAARDLLDIEPRWSYTVFLQMLGRYLEYKDEIGERDAMYAYARASLLRYARWMVEHESPYLDHPERLEFPNETWVAQDARKSEAFDFAARHASPEERERFLERAAYFWHYATETLATLPTRTLTRPMVLMLVHGSLRAHMRRHPEQSAPPADNPSVCHPPRSPFVMQKARAKRRLIGLALSGAAAALAAVVAIVWRLW